MPPSPPPSPGSPVASGQTTAIEPAANFVRFFLVIDEAQYCANKATFDANVCAQIACTQWYCRCILDLKSGYVCPSSRRRALSQTPSSAGQLQVTAALPPTYTSAFADVQKYAGWLVGEPKVGQGDVPVSSASGPSTGTLSTSFVAPAPTPPPPPPPSPASPSPPPKGGLPGEATSVGMVQDYTTEFKSNVDGCLAKKAVPILVAHIAERMSSALGYSFSSSMVHVTALKTTMHEPWDNTANGDGLCPVDTGRRLEARRLNAPACSTTVLTSCYCSSGACYEQTTFAVVIRVPTAAGTGAAAVTSTMDAIRAAMYSNPALTTLVPGLLNVGELAGIMQLSGSTATAVSAAYSATIYGATPTTTTPQPPPASSDDDDDDVVSTTKSPPPPSPAPPPFPPPPRKSPPPPPPPQQCACNQLINGADPFNTCVKIQGKMRICNGIGLTSSGENLCPSDHLLCPSSLGQTSASGSSSGVCKDKEGKYADKKCAKKQAAGKCSKKKMKKKCRKTCGHC